LLACGPNREITAPLPAATVQAPTRALPSSPVLNEPSLPRLAFVTNNPSQFWQLAEAGLRTYEREAHVRFDMKLPPNGTPEDQNRILLGLGEQGYDAVAVSVVSARDQLPVLDRLAQQTNLITFDSDAEQSKRLLYIGTDNFVAGKVLGERVTQLLPQGGKIAVFVGNFANANASQRLAGLLAATRSRNPGRRPA
jgi:ribose transport system substrate-binding protein